MTNDTRLRSSVEAATAVLLGLVSVATAVGAYQATEWSSQAAAYEQIGGQLRDESLALNIESSLASADDGERIADVLAMEFLVLQGSAEVEEVRARQEVILAAGSPGLAAEWQRFVDAGYPTDAPPLGDPEFVAAGFAPTFGANRASAEAFALADELGGRSLQVTVASAIFALALLLLGVSGANRSTRVALGLAFGGATAFVAGVVISALAVVG